MYCTIKDAVKREKEVLAFDAKRDDLISEKMQELFDKVDYLLFGLTSRENMTLILKTLKLKDLPLCLRKKSKFAKKCMRLSSLNPQVQHSSAP